MALDYLRFITEGVDRDEALNELMKEYGREVWHYAYFLTKDADQADDIMQDVFIRAYERMHTFRGQATVKTWLLSITRNAVSDHRRSYWFRKVTLVDYVLESRSSPSAEHELMNRIEIGEIWQQVLKLRAPLREVLLLHAYHEMSHAQIAALLGISEGTVKSRLNRARAKVNKMMGRFER